MHNMDDEDIPLENSLMLSENRPIEDIMKQLIKQNPGVQELSFSHFLRQNGTDPWTTIVLKLLWMREKAEAAWKADDLVGAIEKYKVALRIPSGGEAVYLYPEFYNTKYIDLFEPIKSWVLHIDMVSCCVSITQLYMQLKDYSKVLLYWSTNQTVLC